MDKTEWHERTLEKLLFAGIQEKRRKRRWGIFFKLFFIALILLILISPTFLADKYGFDLGDDRSKDHTALVDVRGDIFDETEANADHIAASLAEAMSNPHAKGVVLRINSPGGSPVQSSYVYNEIKRLQEKYKTKIVAVCSDVCASGAYYIAAACDEIYANPSSLVGSIGAVMSSFGLVDTLTKIGVQRRLLTSGEHKGFLDPFLPMKANEVAHAKKMLKTLHQQFINDVKAGRGKRLHTDPDLFSGLVWSGEEAKTLGLIDGFGSAGYVAREIFKTETVIDYTHRPNYFERFGKYMSMTLTKESTKVLLRELQSYHLQVS